jgi:carboxylate-amine ligase
MSRLAAPVNVLDHHFGTGPPLTVGVEEEYMLLDAESLELAQRSEEILRSESHGDYADLVSAELFESLVEFHTPVCASITDVERELCRIRAHAVSVASDRGLRLGSAGTHPFSLFERQRVTRRERYRALVAELQYAARRELIFGLHVHVAVDDPDFAVRVMGLLESHLGELVALSASSPFWRGRATGLASCRHVIFSAFPRSGPPPRFESYEQYAAAVGELVACGCIEDYTRIWWDVRPHPRFGTVEVRVMDAVSRIEDAVALAAYVQALVAYHRAEHDACQARRPEHPMLTRENKWRAERHGLEATVVDRGGGGPVPITRMIENTLRDIAPHARDLGCDREVVGVRRIVRDGNGADRQLAVHASTGDIAAVTLDIAEVTGSGLDLSSRARRALSA